MCFEETDLHFKNNAFDLFHYKYVLQKYDHHIFC